jgi:7,8-dihydroneopterin aldolase/epimerase/oxygenase
VPSPASTSTEIALTGMRFHARVGILPHERELPQPIEIDLRVGRTADADGVLDYRRLHEVARSAVSDEPMDFLETIAGVILTGALALPGVSWARVAVRKPHVALGGPLDHAEIVAEGVND